MNKRCRTELTELLRQSVESNGLAAIISYRDLLAIAYEW